VNRSLRWLGVAAALAFFGLVFSTLYWGSPYSIIDALRPQPIFAEWRPHEFGYHWQGRRVATPDGADLCIDRRRNIVLIARTRISEEQDSLFAITITTADDKVWSVDTTPNCIIVLSGAKIVFPAPVGFAEKVFEQAGVFEREGLFQGLKACEPSRELFTALSAVLSD